MKHVFVWTVSDIFGLIVVALILLAALFIGALQAWEKIKHWWRNR